MVKHPESGPTLELIEEGRVLPTELADTGRELLLTAQQSVDTIVRSPLNEREPLHEATRVRTVLGDVG